MGDGPQQFNGLLYRGADPPAAMQALNLLSGPVAESAILDQTFEVLGLTLPVNALLAAAQVPGVYTIQPVLTNGGLRGEMSDQVNVNNVGANNVAFPGYPTWLAGVNLSGSGVIMANVDGGIQNDHPVLVNRLIGCIGTTCGGSASSNHGTHTAGIMAADGSGGVRDSLGFLRGLGVAPGARLVEQLYCGPEPHNCFYNQTNGMLLLMTDSYRNSALLSSNSWGPSGTPQGYDNQTRQVDVGVRDADPNAAGNQPLAYVLATMNGNGGTSTQGTPDEGKNIFTIGSTKMQTSTGAQILEIDDLSFNTAHGPALDGRTIPHMVAPGCYVDSSVTGSSYAVYPFCGTSMACPQVSGAIALFIEYYRRLFPSLPNPSPALIKAAFTAVAHDLAGHLEGGANPGVLGHPFDSKQGWGRMDLEAVVDPQVSVLYFDNPLILNNTGEQWLTTLTPGDPTKSIRLMLVWTDAPGHGLGGSTPAWNNNLDLTVQIGANTYRGNNFGTNGWSQPGGTADFKNNTEGVFLAPPGAVSMTVRVIAGDINSDGIPNQGDTTDQDFALVCYNCARDCNANGIPDGQEIASGTTPDCNNNSIPDSCDIANGTSIDCEPNGIPDECETLVDCNQNSVRDICDILLGTSADCEPNGIPDECSFRGACCLSPPDGPCVVTTQICCANEGGWYFGNNTQCHAWTCGQINGPSLPPDP